MYFALCWFWALLQGGLCLGSHSLSLTVSLLHSNKWQCLPFLSCSSASMHCFWNHLFRRWIGLSQTLHSTLHNYEFLLQFKQPTPAPFLENCGPNPSSSHKKGIPKWHRKVLESFQAAPSLLLSLPAVPHSEYLQTENIVNQGSQIYTVPLTHIHSHTQYMLFIYKLPFKRETRKIQLSPNAISNVLCLVLIDEWTSESSSGYFCQKNRVRTVFIRRGWIICMSSCDIMRSGAEALEKANNYADVIEEIRTKMPFIIWKYHLFSWACRSVGRVFLLAKKTCSPPHHYMIAKTLKPENHRFKLCFVYMKLFEKRKGKERRNEKNYLFWNYKYT